GASSFSEFRPDVAQSLMIDCGLSEDCDIGLGQRLRLVRRETVQAMQDVIGEACDIIVAEVVARRHGANESLALDLDRSGEAADDDERDIAAFDAARLLERVGDERRSKAWRANPALLMAS